MYTYVYVHVCVYVYVCACLSVSVYVDVLVCAYACTLADFLPYYVYDPTRLHAEIWRNGFWFLCVVRVWVYGRYRQQGHTSARQCGTDVSSDAPLLLFIYCTYVAFDSLSTMPTHTHTYTHIHADKYTRTHTKTREHSRVCTHTHAHTYACRGRGTRTVSHTHAHIRTHEDMYRCRVTDENVHTPYIFT